MFRSGPAAGATGDGGPAAPGVALPPTMSLSGTWASMPSSSMTCSIDRVTIAISSGLPDQPPYRTW